ncbi:MAG: hypothetical protein BJ554DRAFT_3964 [Olpidium bornovanus]|uniref:Uncharacterized protein n=1 Tax=Olpidium bornovanus TaxID=278681 RepID=A0A8H7ZMV0_9FUNG|nr:MAG: hypothetical protein BJ554DRAFT_3964 [Olpidium bornovanus]
MRIRHTNYSGLRILASAAKSQGKNVPGRARHQAFLEPLEPPLDGVYGGSQLGVCHREPGNKLGPAARSEQTPPYKRKATE